MDLKLSRASDTILVGHFTSCLGLGSVHTLLLNLFLGLTCLRPVSEPWVSGLVPHPVIP